MNCFCFHFAEMDRLKNGNSMTASSRSTALAIVADLLRRVNVGDRRTIWYSPQFPISSYSPSSSALSHSIRLLRFPWNSFFEWYIYWLIRAPAKNQIHTDDANLSNWPWHIQTHKKPPNCMLAMSQGPSEGRHKKLNVNDLFLAPLLLVAFV